MRRLKDFVKRRVPGAQRAHHMLRTLPLRLRSPREIFTNYYGRNSWAGEESVSGPGSSLAETEAFRDTLAALVEEIGCRTLLDAPCGDYHLMRHTPLRLERYIGVDIVDEIVAANQATYGDATHEFRALDFIAEAPPRADLILRRDCLVHFSPRAARAALQNFRRSGSRYLLTTHYVSPKVNPVIATGEWYPINLERPPFDFPPPLRSLREHSDRALEQEQGKTLALWDLQEPRLWARGSRAR